jgi:hypothetical protein
MKLSDMLERRRRRNPNRIEPKKMIIEKLKQPSTIKGVLALLSVIGLQLSDEAIEGVSQVILAALALWEILRNERIPKAEVVE